MKNITESKRSFLKIFFSFITMTILPFTNNSYQLNSKKKTIHWILKKED